MIEDNITNISKENNLFDSPINEIDIEANSLTSRHIPKQKNDEYENKFDLRYCIDTVLKEAIKEEKLVKQIFYTMLSAYTNNPINLAINAPSGEGKTHALTKVANLFPKQDVLFIADMSNKAIFHKNGYLAIKNDEGQYASVENVLEQLIDEIETKKSELNKNLDSSIVIERKREITQLQQRIKEIQRNAVKIIDLSHKILIFLDTPRQEIFEALMTLLSHDKYEVEYQYVDSSNKSGLKTKTNVLKGWPAVIFAQAIDYTKHSRYQEIQRRFIVTNPRMDVEKYRGAIDLIVEKNSVPDFVYQKRVVSDFDKEIAGEIISNIKDDLLSFSNTIEPGKNNVIIPFSHLIKQIVSKNVSSQDMTFANRLMNYIVLMTSINHKNRPYVEIYRSILDYFRIPMALYSDLAEALALLNNSAGGIRPYILDWYRAIFMKLYKSKSKPDSKITYDRGEITEQRIGVTTQELIETTKKIMNKSYTSKTLLSEFIYPLSNLGYLDSISSEIDRRAKLYFPVLDVEDKYINLFLEQKKNKLLEGTMTYNTNSSTDYDKNCIISYTEMVIKYYSENEHLVTIKDEDINKSVSIQEIVDKYYSSNVNETILKDYSYSPVINSDLQTPSDKLKSQLLEEYIDKSKNHCNLQSILQVNAIYNNDVNNLSKNILLSPKKNKLIYSCYRCDFKVDSRTAYEKHCIVNHPNKSAYPNLASIYKDNLTPQGKPWE